MGFSKVVVSIHDQQQITHDAANAKITKITQFPKEITAMTIVLTNII